MKLLRLLILATVACTVPACSSWSKKGSTSSARLYDGDESPHIQMYTDSQGPGSMLND